MIKITNLHKYFYKGEPREVHALNDVELVIEDGEFTLLNGPSGCGKSTLLNLIGALDDLSEGEIYFDDDEVSSLGEEDKTTLRLEQIGFVFQAYNLIPVLNVKENIAFIMRLRGFEESFIENRVTELAKLLDITDKLEYLPNNLSGGEQQRVAVARAVATKPKIILADEPTANLDSINSKILIDMMKELNEKEGLTIIFASHDEMVKENVRRVINMYDGEIVDG
ncbi:ABC transporter ATP-binding protein [Sulfurimonas marina]|uniref:ABC transporter ATP-binding protein n=1 Tax=Sulfurimonas marina TaxID=2590551 RepID=A0A7M1AX75_9BACT|nr:ABC transporter ATP-binding protein [Sulfurimonas marina]QOP42015.1 ABC transporter ATP-binding protein [Sulfurimonas marina]